MQAASIAAAGAPTSYSPTSTAGLESDAFLQLLVAQLRYQDPMSPMENSEFIAQLAQLNTLEQLKQMNASLDYLLSLEVFSQAADMLGKEVQAKTGIEGTLVEGLVSEVRVGGGMPVLIVDGQEVTLAELVKIMEAPDGTDDVAA